MVDLDAVHRVRLAQSVEVAEAVAVLPGGHVGEGEPPHGA